MEFRGFGVHIFKEIRRPFYSMAGCGGYLILHTGADSTKAMTQADGVMVIDLASKRTRELDHGFNCIDGVTGNSRYMLAYSGDVVIPFFKSKRLRTIDLEDKLESKSRIDFMAADDEHLFVASDEIIFKFAIKEYGKVPLDQIK